MEDVVVGNETLRRIFGHAWSRVRSITYEGRELHMAYDICAILGITNVTTGIKGVDGAYRVDLENRAKRYVQQWNARRKVHLLSLEGVFQLIINNKAAKCKEIKRYLTCNYLPGVDGLVLYERVVANESGGGVSNG